MTVQVLFVDDEQSILDGMRRMLRKDRADIEAEFVPSGPHALELMAHKPFDVVVSDMRMPQMSGLELLSTVKERHPTVVRIVLSGHAEREMMLKSVGVAHQYLHKPCDADTIRRAVMRSIRLRGRFQEPALLAAVSDLGQLPTMPSLYAEITSILREADATLHEVGSLIARDPGITTKLLQLVNSSFFGLAREVSSPQEATALLGGDVVSSVVVAAELYSAAWIPAEELDRLWLRSMQVANAMGKLARHVGLDAKIDSSHLVGILHLVGRMAVAVRRPEIFKGAPEQERAVLGYSCEDIGGYLLDIWGLPDGVVEAVTCYRRPSETMAEAITVTSLLHCAVATFEAGPDGQPALDYEHLEAIGAVDQIDHWVGICREAMYG